MRKVYAIFSSRQIAEDCAKRLSEYGYIAYVRESGYVFEVILED